MSAPPADAAPAVEEGRIAPCSGHALELEAGDELVVIDPLGEQVSDLTAFARDDTAEYLSSGRSIDYASKLWLSTGDVLYSNRSRPMLAIVEDTCGRHDFTLTPCSKEMFEKLYGEQPGRPGCEGNLASALAPWGIGRDRIPVAFNIFMRVEMDPARRRVTRDGTEIQLTGKEYALLEYLMRNQGVVLSEARIIEHVWDMNHDSMTNTVNVYIHHLRTKIDRGRSRRLIHTIRGAGFMLSERETDPA